ncbi:hypothetical protein R3P38DRAFT_3206477 [Favolaschia claudopus]|uniref:Uncharacterized protein n=1 Tax=Favolaschia claudopus TaxID=2862362 RepID=A0AAW0AL62_9AGAR
MNRITSPAIRNGTLPVITLDFPLHAVDLAIPSTFPTTVLVEQIQECAVFSLFSLLFSSLVQHFLNNTDWHQILLNAWAAHVEREEILQRLTRGNDSGRNEEKVSDCLKHVEQQFKARRHRDVQHDPGGFHAESDERGENGVAFRFAWIDLIENSQVHQEDSLITRLEVAAILNDPNVDGICAALAVAAAVSPILLLSTQNYANATYNPSTSVSDASVSSD